MPTLPKQLDQLSMKEIRTQLLYCKEDPVKTLVLRKRLEWLIEHSESTNHGPSKKTNDITKASKATKATKAIATATSQPRMYLEEPELGEIDEQELWDEICGDCSDSDSNNKEGQIEHSEQSDESFDDDLEYLEEFMMEDDQSNQDPSQSRERKPPKSDRMISKDFVNNGLMRRLNAEMEMKREPMTTPSRRQFETPFGSGGTENHSSFEGIISSAPGNFLNPNDKN